MKLQIVFFFAIAITLAFDLTLIARHHRSPESPSSCAVIHKPAKAECPKGYVQESTPRFTERDGSKEFACVSADPAKEPCFDELRPGEGMVFHLQIPDVKPPAPKPAGERKP